MRPLLDIPFAEWPEALGLSEKESYRARQLQTWVFTRKAKTFLEMSDLPIALRERWEGSLRLRTLRLDRREISESDGTARSFFEAPDGRAFSAVHLPARGSQADRAALCLSTQAGCAWACVFCASGRVPFLRNLTASEMVEPVFWAEEAAGRRPESLVFMGMGEPLANPENLSAALRILRSPMGLGYGARHVTVSTVGIVPEMRRLAGSAPKVNLAVSLHAADDETRRKLLPKTAAWPVKEVLKAAWDYQREVGSGRVTFEYILIHGVNDSVREAQRLSNLLRGKKSWVNLIAYNPVRGLPYRAPEEGAIAAFAKVLSDRGLFVRVRRPQGRDIEAACGQLGPPGPVGGK